MFAPFAFMGGAAAAIVQPDEISNLIAWYDFSDSNEVTLVGGDVDSITDKSTSNITMNYVTARPLYNSGGGPNSTSYMYNTQHASDQYLEAASSWPGPNDGKEQTAFFIGFMGGGSYDSVVHTTKFPSVVPSFFMDTTNPTGRAVFSLKDGGGTPPYGSEYDTPGTGASNFVYAIGIGSSGTNYSSEAYVGGTWTAGASRAFGSVTGVTPLRFLRGNSFRSSGGVAEYWAYDRVLTSTEIDDMKAYIENKYGL